MKQFLATCIAAVFAFVSTDGSADTYIVGPGVGGGITACTHATLQEAVDAAAAHAGPDEIHMVMQSDLISYTSQAIVISDPELTIRGGYSECSVPSISGRTILSGYLGFAAPVMRIEVPCSEQGPAANIQLVGLELVDGDSNSLGGGLYIDVCGRVAIENTRVANNQATYGGGIYVHGHGDMATQLLLGDEVQIEDNAALAFGGGIAIESAFLQLGGTNTVVRRNATKEQGRGGGIWLQSWTQSQPARATIQSGGQGNDGVIAGNHAGEGGGLFVGMSAKVRMFSSQATRPVSIERNTAEIGAGISVRGPGSVEMWESILHANHSRKGGAAVMASDRGMFSMASKSEGNAPGGTVACIPRTACNRVTGNIAAGEGQDNAPGAVALVSNGSIGGQTDVSFESVSIQGNLGSSLFGDECETGSCEMPMRIDVRGSRIDGNSLTPRILGVGFRTSFTCTYCTIARVVDSPESLFESNGLVSLTHSIIWARDRDVIGGQTPAQLEAFDLLLHDRADFPLALYPVATNILVADPRFVDVDAADIHLKAHSPALDVAGDRGAPNFDLDDNPRGVDQPGVPNLSGPFDLGAYETPFTIDAIFENGFE